MSTYLINAVATRPVGHEDTSEVVVKYTVDSYSYHGAYTQMLSTLKNMGLRLIRHTISVAPCAPNIPPPRPELPNTSEESPAKWYDDTTYVTKLSAVHEPVDVQSHWSNGNNANYTP